MFPCSSQLPALQFGIEQKGSHTIPGQTLNAGPVDSSNGNRILDSLHYWHADLSSL